MFWHISIFKLTVIYKIKPWSIFYCKCDFKRPCQLRIDNSKWLTPLPKWSWENPILPIPMGGNLVQICRQRSISMVGIDTAKAPTLIGSQHQAQKHLWTNPFPSPCSIQESFLASVHGPKLCSLWIRGTLTASWARLCWPLANSSVHNQW